MEDLSRARSGTFRTRFLEEFTGVYIVFGLLPLIFRFARLYLFQNQGWIRIAVMHVAGAACFSFLHTSLMAITRWLIAPLVGLGPYNYGIMRYRYPMEFSNDLLGYTIIVLAFYFVERLRIAQAQQLAAAELRAKLAQAQLQNLRLQLQPHFLFNTLNTISAVMYQDLGAADAILRQLSDLLRLTLRAANSQEVPLAQELEITRLYLKIMQQRFEEKLRVTYRVAPEFENSLVPQLILQPLVENSLRHGLKNSESGIDIVIAAQRENGTLILRVADTGAGLGRRQSESRRNPARPGPSQHQAADGAALWRRPAAWNCQPIRSTLCPRVPAMHRCSSAKELLNDWTLSLTDVALSCGFADQSHFTRVFNALVGCPPGEWRSRNGGSASVA